MNFNELTTATLLIGLVIHRTLASLISGIVDHTDGLQFPTFTTEPSSRLVFSNDTGSQISCAAHGNPQPLVTWLFKDGSTVNSVPGLRQIEGNGTLYFPAFAGQYYRSDVHSAIYRCRASNVAGTILSREVSVRAVLRESFDVKIDGFSNVILGNSIFLRCIVSSNVKEFVEIVSWHVGDEVLLPERSNIGGHYMVTNGYGDLFVRNVRSEDSIKQFSCLAANSLTGERQQSAGIILSIKDISPNTPPQANQKSSTEISIDRGSDIHLPCFIQSNPAPIFSWYRISDSGALYPIPTTQHIIQSHSILLIRNIDERDAGKWVCKAANQYGEKKLEIQLNVNSYLSVHVYPQIQIISSGGKAVFNCSVTGTPITKIEWFHNGSPIMDNDINSERNKIVFASTTSLMINNVGKEDRGVYQCIVANTKYSAQAASHLKLGDNCENATLRDTFPELLYTFIEQNIRPGQHISLKCSASGTPPPQFTWFLDTQTILDISMNRYAIGQFVDISGDVISHLNISHSRSEDGGLYKCVASNSIGSVSHSTRLNVYGPPYIRPISPLKAIAGEDVVVYCPFSGYPIDTVRWQRSGNELTSSSRYSISSIQQGGYLKIFNLDSSNDAGIYTCTVVSRTGEEARRDIQLNVNSPPVIETFAFPKNLQEGGRAQVTCSVSAGDMPIYFSWQKDKAPIPLSLQVQEKKEEFFSLLVFKDITSKHSGKYTCFALNTAAKVNFTAELLVKVSPQWSVEPQDTAVMVGNQLNAQCEAHGYPAPTISWFRGLHKQSKDFEPLRLKNASLIVNFATASDEGYYMCQAHNDIGVGLKKVFFVNINEPARFENNLQNVSSKRGGSINLDCRAYGDEPLNIVWTHNNARIDLNNYRTNLVEIKLEDGINSQLSITQSDRQDSGTYKCTAENPYGRSENFIYLAVQERPEPPTNMEIIEVGSRTVKMSWRRSYDGNSPVLRYLVQHKPLKSLQSMSFVEKDWQTPTVTNTTLSTIMITKSTDGDFREQAVVSGLRPATTYLLRMLAENEIERSEYTDPLVIKTQEEAPLEAPHAVSVQATALGELVISWQIPPKHSWNGELLGYTVNCSEEKKHTSYDNLNVSSSKTVTVNGWATTKATITSLRKFTRYAIKIRGFNSISPGPWSTPVIGTTLEGVPEAPPRNVNCSALSSQSIKISWQEPPHQFHGGIILGYKILYRPLTKNVDLSSSGEVKRTSNLESYLHGLYKATNYSIRLLAHTSSGDGVTSNPIYCSTEEDVPDPPANIKAAALTADCILVSWLRPANNNGILTHYTVYFKESGRKGQAKEFLVRVDENGKPVTYEARGLTENQSYEFWVTASTAIGEGEPTSVVIQATNTRAPARIASFSQVVKRAVGNNLILECLAVGNPTPRARWITRGRPVTFSPFYEVTTSGSLKIHSVEPSLSGNYTCSAKNLFGEDEINYTVIAMKTPNPPQLTIQYKTMNSFRFNWEKMEDGGSPIVGYVIAYRIAGEVWMRVELAAEQNSYVLSGLKCGTQYVVKISAFNRVGEGAASDEKVIWTKGKVSQAPEEDKLIQTNGTCLNLLLSSWDNGGCPISHFSIEYRSIGDINWKVVSSDISTHDEKDDLVFCDFAPASWYQLRISARNDAGKTAGQYNFATTTFNGDPIPLPDYFPNNDITNDVITMVEEDNLLSSIIVGIIMTVAIFLIFVILKYRGALCSPISQGYESRTIPIDIKEEHENRMNQQVYTASPVKMSNKDTDSEMYEISPYATFSVAGGRTTSSGGHQAHAKTPTRGLNASALDYTLQFKTFGHPETENLNSTAYPLLSGSGFGHVKGKSSWHKQKYYSTDDDSTLSKSMTVVAGSSRHRSGRDSNNHETRLMSRSSSRQQHPQNGSESDASISPVIDFTSAPTYRIPVKSSKEMFRPDSSTESNNDNSPLQDRRCNTPRHLNSEMKGKSKTKSRDSQSMDGLRHGSNNSLDSEVNFRPPSAFNDSREFSEAECDRESALDLEVQRTMAKQEELTSLLARYQEKKEQERQEYTIHV